MHDDFTVIHEFDLGEMPKRRLLELFRAGARLYTLCAQPGCPDQGQYVPLLSDRELMTYCLRCGSKILTYGVEERLV